jgi:hypothetical protein
VDVACPGADKEALLDELLAAGSVEVVDSTTVRCLSRAYVPKGADIERIERVGRFLGSLTDSMVRNLMRAEPEPLYFERAVVSDELMSEGSRDKFLTLAGERSQELLTELDTFLARLAETEASTTGKRYGVGVYFFEDESAPHTDTKIGEQKRELPKQRIEEIDVLAGIGRKK